MSDQETTGTDVAVREQARQDVAARFDGASDGMITFLADLSVAYEIASRLVTTSFVPQSYANKPQEAAAAIVAGQGIGLGPMEALRSIDIIQGTPAMRAITLRALVVSHGHEIWVEESTPTRAVVCGRRAGSDKVQRSEWDLDRARALNLLSKDNWKNQPGVMLIARATSEIARLIAPDALLGIPYSTEELQDLDERPSAASGGAVRTARQLPTVASRMRAAQATAEAQASDAPPVDVDAGDGRTEPEAADSEVVVEGFECSNCGLPRADDEGGICGPCELQIEAEMSAGEEQS